MKKRLVALAMAAMMTLSMGTTAMAADANTSDTKIDFTASVVTRSSLD